ncbi:MAG: 50S ribosomal protein L15 [Gemmatimonadota bacterium]
MAEREKLGLDNLSPAPGSKSSRQRVGRGNGSGLGGTSGRGHKGQKARSGGKVAPWFEGGQMPLHRRTPKRGFTPRTRTEFSIVNLGDLQRVEGSEVDPEILRAHGLVRSAGHPVKILADGDLSRPLTVRAHAFSAAARQKIEAAGGTAELIE